MLAIGGLLCFLVGMAIIVEDGTGLANANSFVTVAEARAYATDRGITLPAADVEVERALIKAGDYMFRYEKNLKGSRVTTTQRLPYPRYPVNVFGTVILKTDIPIQLKEAQIELGIESSAGVALRPNGSGREVLMEKVGPISTQYSETGSGSNTPTFYKALDLLAPLLKSASGSFMEVVRG